MRVGLVLLLLLQLQFGVSEQVAEVDTSDDEHVDFIGDLKLVSPEEVEKANSGRGSNFQSQNSQENAAGRSLAKFNRNSNLDSTLSPTDLNFIRAQVEREFEKLKNESGFKYFNKLCGDKCYTAGNNANVRIVENESDVWKISFALQLGSLIFVKSSNQLLMKVESSGKQWVVIRDLTTSTRRTLNNTTDTKNTNNEANEKQNSAEERISTDVAFNYTDTKLRLIALPQRLPGNMKVRSASGILGADYACQLAASEAGFNKTRFRALLHGKYNRLDVLVHASQRADVPVVNIKGQKLFKNYKQMLQNGNWPQSFQIYDFNGKVLSQQSAQESQNLAWQGLRSKDKSFTEEFLEDCDSYSISSDLVNGLATNLMKHKLFESVAVTCDAKLIVLCIETHDESIPLKNPSDYRRI